MEHDPFLTHGGTRTAARSGKFRPTGPGTATFVLLPWAAFLAVTLAYAVFYHHFKAVTTVIVFLCGATSLTSVAMSAQQGRGYLLLGVLCFMATVTGTLFGLYNYHENVMPYWAYMSDREYSNVLPSEPAAAHADAGKIEFALGSKIDSTKAVGYKEGEVYCVVPITGDVQASRVEYWAVGMNCCKQRADFQCDDAGDAEAHSGVVILDTNSFFPSNRDMYKKAVKQAEAAFDLVSSPNPVFVRWKRNPQKVQEAYWTDAWGDWLIATALYGVLSALLGVVCGSAGKAGAR